MTEQTAVTKVIFGDLVPGDNFTDHEGTPYQKIELQQLPRYGWVNAVATTEAGKYYKGDTGHRHIYDDVKVTVVQ